MAEITPLLRTSGHTCQGNGLRTAHSGSHCAHFIAVAPLMKTTLGDAQHKSQHWMSGNRPRSAQEKAGVQCMGRARGVLTSSFTSICVPQGGSSATRHTTPACKFRNFLRPLPRCPSSFPGRAHGTPCYPGHDLGAVGAPGRFLSRKTSN